MDSAKVGLREFWFHYVLIYLYVMVLYLLTNHYMFKGPHFLTMTPLDQKVPLMPWTVWIYASVYVLPLIAASFVTKREDVMLMMSCFILIGTLCAIIFVFYPTVYPRPTVLLESGPSAWLLKSIWSVDSPANSWPSQHVALAFMSAFFVLKYNRKWGSLVLFAAILISISTLTTKQHYIWDILCGYLLARIIFVVAAKVPLSYFKKYLI